jgi:hypothetical protein
MFSQSLKTSHCLDVGIDRMLPTKGSFLGPGGVDRVRFDDFHARKAVRARAPTPDTDFKLLSQLTTRNNSRVMLIARTELQGCRHYQYRLVL